MPPTLRSVTLRDGRDFMSVLDAHKGEMTSEVYRQLCNAACEGHQRLLEASYGEMCTENEVLIALNATLQTDLLTMTKQALDAGHESVAARDESIRFAADATEARRECVRLVELNEKLVDRLVDTTKTAAQMQEAYKALAADHENMARGVVTHEHAKVLSRIEATSNASEGPPSKRLRPRK